MANMTKNYDSCDIFEQFEIHRLSANHHLSKYFECLDRPQGTDRLAGLNTKVISSRTCMNLNVCGNAGLAKTSHTCAIQDLEILDKLLSHIVLERRSLIKPISPGIFAWSISCLILAYTLQGNSLSAAFKFGGFGGTFLLTLRLLRKYLQLRTVVPFQHKVRGLIRAFKNGTIRYRELEEVLIFPL
ncbi:hypothetical protein BKA59DRAFT_513555 [Fusarium tricinctum]|uniref:Uncharacterized protein n=1 Tax=Fusarium tricinctum TaxID=61284 RepID=A0A8K0RVX0_9HYPO|nr:hypothetical protein BKA59DRAFT_513555 [Fusarium tricinctum]